MRLYNVLKTFLICFFICLFVGCGGKADSYYEEAVTLYSQGDYEKATELFEKAIEANPDKAEYYIDYGITLISLGRYDEARSKLQSIMRDTDSKIVRENNKKAYRGIALSYYSSGEYDQAKAYFELALGIKELESIDKDIKAYLAECLMHLQEYDESLELWNSIIEENDEAEYYLGRASLHSLMGNADLAIADYNNCISEDKHLYGAYLALYNTQIDAGYADAAAETIITAMEIIKDKKSEESFDYYIFNYYYLKNSQETGTDSLADGFASFYNEGELTAGFYLGRIAEDSGDYEKAYEYYTKYAAECSGEIGADFCNQYATCLTQLEKYDEALEWITKGCSMAGGTAKQKLLFNEVIIYEKNGKYDIAEEKAAYYLEVYNDELMAKEYEFIKTRIKPENEN